MAVYKRGTVYWYNFTFNGEHIQESTKQGSKRVGEQMEAARKTQLAKGEVGIKDRKPIPTLCEFAPKFIETIETQCAEKPLTIDFCKAKLKYLLAYELLAGSRLDAIDEAIIDAFKQARVKYISRRGKPLSPASVNRELATLRRLLRLAHEWKIIGRVPRIRLLRGEHQRESILSHEQEALYLETLPQIVGQVALLLLDTGLRLGEALSLDWSEVHLKPANGAAFGYLTVLSGKAKSKKSRNVPLSNRAVAMLMTRGPVTGLVFSRLDRTKSSKTLMDQQHARVRELLRMPGDFVLHSLRHTFGTRLGESGADPFTIMKLMGHSSITVSQRYVHLLLNRWNAPSNA